MDCTIWLYIKKKRNICFFNNEINKYNQTCLNLKEKKEGQFFKQISTAEHLSKSPHKFTKAHPYPYKEMHLSSWEYISVVFRSFGVWCVWAFDKGLPWSLVFLSFYLSTYHRFIWSVLSFRSKKQRAAVNIHNSLIAGNIVQQYKKNHKFAYLHLKIFCWSIIMENVWSIVKDDTSYNQVYVY